jgi:hypothetical protein
MKKMKKCLISILVLGIAIISCTKDEAVVVNSSQKAKTTKPLYYYSVSERNTVGLPGIDPAEKLTVVIDTADPAGGHIFPFKIINLPTPSYKKETKLLDISKLENHKTYHAIKCNDLIVGFFDSDGADIRALKLEPNPNGSGWTDPWGYSPNVEAERPEVLYFNVPNPIVTISDQIVTVLYLSKPCIEFGFELTPDLNDYSLPVNVSFGTWFTGFFEGSVTSMVSSPAGARLFSVKATKPFTIVTITLLTDDTVDLPWRGIGMANIRYKLAD